MKTFKSFIQLDEINKQQFDEAESHQSKTTMKHISNPNAAEKKAAKDIKPGIKGVKDRLDMLRAAKARGALKEDDLAELSTKTLAKAAKSASDPDSDYSYGKSHDPQKFADHAKKTKDAKSAAAVQGAADAKGHYPRPGHTVGSYDKLAHRSPARVTSAGKANKQDVNKLKGNIKRNEDVQLDELSTKTLAKAAKSASDPDSDHSYGKSHDPQKFADHAKKTKDAKSAAAVQGAADAKSHYTRPGHTVGGNDTLANRTKSRITATGKANKQDVKTLKGKIQSRNEDVDVEMLLNLYDGLDESNQEIFLAQLEEDAEVLLAFAKTIAEE